MLEYDRPTSDVRPADGAVADGDLPDDYSDWDDYVPEGIQVSEEELQRLHTEHEKYVAELIAEVGEPTPEELERAEAFWRPIVEHLSKGYGECAP